MDKNNRRKTLIKTIALFYIGLHSIMALAANDVAKEEVTPPPPEGALSMSSILPLANSASRVAQAAPNTPPSPSQPANSPPASDSTNVMPPSPGPKIGP